MSLKDKKVEEPQQRSKYREGSSKRLKVYEEALVESIYGLRSKEPLQAVVSNQLNEDALEETNNTTLERNRALLQYVATLAKSNSLSDEFNYEFIESLVQGGADINIADQYGQTLIHEVARSWNTDIASFIVNLGCDINRPDVFGRTSLHVAAAVDFADMTTFLLENKADIDARTSVEQQAPVHLAAKNGAVRSLEILLGFNVDINSKDYKGRTPLQLAGEWSRANTTKLLLDEGATSYLLDSCGNSALCVLIDQLPNLARHALDQLHISDVITLREFYYLNYLEKKPPGSTARIPLEVAVATQKYEVVSHSVMQRLIHNKWIQYGRFSTLIDIAFHVVYGIVFTIGCTGRAQTGKNIWNKPRIRQNVFLAIIAIMTVYDIFVHITATIKSRMSQKAWVTWRTNQLEDDLLNCHPAWPQEQRYVEREIKRVKNLPLFNSPGAWFYVEWITLILLVATALLYIVHSVVDTAASGYIYPRALSILNLLVWLRLLRYVRPIPGIGTLVIILGETATDFINWAFLYFLLLLPFTAAFWINFGGLSPQPVKGYSEVQQLLYSVFRIAVGDDFNFDGLDKADPVMSRILLVLYIVAMTIVTLNLLIALLSDTFSRVYGNAYANTIMQRAIKVVDAEGRLTKKGHEKYEEYMATNCAPESIKVLSNEANISMSENAAEKESREQLRTVNTVLLDRFGTSYGKTQVTDFDMMRQDVEKIRIRQDRVAEDLVEISKMLKVYVDNYPEIRRKLLEEDAGGKPSKSFLASLQEIASSLFQRLSANRADQAKEKKSVEGRRRGRRRRTDEDNNEDRRAARKRRREKKRSKRSKRDKSNDETADGIVTPRDDNQPTVSIEVNSRQPDKVIQWDNMSIDM